MRMRLRGHGRHIAISEFIATLIMIAVTLVAGTSAFGWILLQTGTSENSYGNSVAVNVNFLNERFVLVSESFSGTGGGPCAAGACTNASLYVYNTGTVDFTLFTIQIRNLTATTDSVPVNLIFNATGYSEHLGQVKICDSLGGFSGPIKPLRQGGISSSPPYGILMPVAGPCPTHLFDGITYSFTLTGLYGNIVTQSITPNG